MVQSLGIRDKQKIIVHAAGFDLVEENNHDSAEEHGNTAEDEKGHVFYLKISRIVETEVELLQVFEFVQTRHLNQYHN